MTSAQAELFEFLQRSAPTPAAKMLLKRTMEQFVLEHGWWYDPVELPVEISRGKVQHCHKNAADLILADKSLIYCEGYALFKPGSQPTLHSWVTDGNGRAIDNTWPNPGVAYAGVPFKGLFVSMTALKNRATISLIDDWQNSYPLRGELGDRPDEWMELKGSGLARLMEMEATGQ